MLYQWVGMSCSSSRILVSASDAGIAAQGLPRERAAYGQSLRSAAIRRRPQKGRSGRDEVCGALHLESWPQPRPARRSSARKRAPARSTGGRAAAARGAAARAAVGPSGPGLGRTLVATRRAAFGAVGGVDERRQPGVAVAPRRARPHQALRWRPRRGERALGWHRSVPLSSPQAARGVEMACAATRAMRRAAARSSGDGRPCTATRRRESRSGAA